MSSVNRTPGQDRLRAAGGRLRLRYFEDVVADELKAINARRKGLREAVARLAAPRPAAEARAPKPRSPDPGKLFPARHPDAVEAKSVPSRAPEEPADPDRPDPVKIRPKPVPCDATGLAHSGGGIRSAAVCLGALQALHHNHCIRSIDYLSTVSGGGYIGASLTAAMSKPGAGKFPFGDDVSDSPAVAHLRNDSNYLLPRGRSGVRNISEIAAVILRGVLANACLALWTLLVLALLTKIAYPDAASLPAGSFAPRLIDGLLRIALSPLARFGVPAWPDVFNAIFGPHEFRLTLWALIALAIALIVWAVLRSFSWLDAYTGDTKSAALAIARVLIVGTVIVAFLDLQPLLIARVTSLHGHPTPTLRSGGIKWLLGVLASFSGAISFVSGSLGRFLKTTKRATDWKTYLLRGATHFAVFIAALVLPLVLWGAYLYLSAWVVSGWALPPALQLLAPARWLGFARSQVSLLYLEAFLALLVVWLGLRANGYSLHRFYRDRLNRAFLSHVSAPPRDAMKLSQISNGAGPYHIINAAMNVQGSAEANKRGRNADFFMFTRDYVGSDLTMYAPTQETSSETAGMEAIDPRLDLATAMAISGAAVSANMGAETVRLLSPTLALLNIRLGYWLRNPRDLARRGGFNGAVEDLKSRFLEKFFLVLEMLNLLDERSRSVYLSDGGHIENLGVYELLKRGCGLVIAIDAEADPSLSFPSLLTLERYARIDLGVRIALPWGEIAAMTKRVSASIGRRRPVVSRGPHCAVGRIFYEDGSDGVIVYFKSSLSGDEKDYILDYKKRYPAFPHETTADQFFTEEQFEVYRALGFHMVDGFFSRSDGFSYLSDGQGAFLSPDDAFAAVMNFLPAAG